MISIKRNEELTLWHPKVKKLASESITIMYSERTHDSTKNPHTGLLRHHHNQGPLLYMGGRDLNV